MRIGLRMLRRFPAERAKKVKLIILDVDGVMTDGKIIVSGAGGELKNFNVYDGVGIALGRKQGLKFAVITARKSEVTVSRMKELGIEDVFQVEREKIQAYEALLKKHGIADGEAAYMGDDIHDEEPMRRAGLSVAPAGARQPALRAADYVTASRGGEGAVREFVDLVLQSRGSRLSLKVAAAFAVCPLFLSGCGAPVRETPPPPPQREPEASEKVEGGFRYTAAEKGRVVFEIEGASASGLGEGEDFVTIEAPEAVWLRADGRVRARGERGGFGKSTMDVFFEEDARLEYEGRGVVYSDRLDWKRDESVFRAEGSVEGVFLLLPGENTVEDED